MSLISSFILLFDYGFIVLVNPESYVTFVDEYWQIKQFINTSFDTLYLAQSLKNIGFLNQCSTTNYK